MRRGITLLELLLALTLLSTAAVAMLAVTRVATRHALEIDERLAWQRAADMTLNHIGALLIRRDRSEPVERTVRFQPARLEIELADGNGAVVQRDRNTLTVTFNGDEQRLLIGALSEAQFEIDDASATLQVLLRAMHGAEASRSWEFVSQ